MRKTFDIKNKLHITSVLLCLLLCLCALIPHLATADTTSIKYPLEKDVRRYNCYVQQFDAFMKGQLNLDIPVSEDFENLSNPYDRRERDENVDWYPWDRALYDGQYFSYFGIAPIITVYFPSYILTGSIPADSVTCAVLAVVGMAAVCLLLLNLIKYFKIKPPLYLLLLSLFAVEFGSLLPVLMSSSDMYYTALTSGVSFFSLFLALFFIGMNAKKHKNVFFVLSAFAFALVIMSRPNMAVLAVLIVPVLIKYFFRSGNTLKQNALSLISFAVPLMIGAAAVCAYNYLRFDSIFEFGAKYQLTVYDVSKYTFSASLVVPCLYHYFVQFPKITGEFPFINLQYVNLHMHTTEYLYNTSTVGALAFLSNFGAFGIGGILAKPKAHREQKWTYSVAFLSVLLLAYINTCLGGVNIRYFADFAMVMIMFSSLILLEIPSFFKDSRKLVRALVQIIISVLFICSAALGFLLIFENERNYILKAVLG